MKTWMSKGGGAQDILDDMQLLNSIRSFLDSPTDHFIPSSPNFQEPAVKQAWETLNDTRQFLKRNVNSYAMRPPMSRVQPFSRHAVTTTDSRVRNLSTREPPDMDRMSVEEFVDNLDGMAFAAFNNVNEEVSTSLILVSVCLTAYSGSIRYVRLPRGTKRRPYGLVPVS